MAETDKIILRKELGLHHAIAVGIGGLIGSGIFVSPVGILTHAGSIGTSLIVWIFCGICQLMFALCYAELGCRIPYSGGDYTYINTIFGGLLGCIKLWSSLVIFCLAMSVFYGLFARYLLEPFYVGCQIPSIVLSLVFIIAHGSATAVNYYSVRLVARLQVFFTSAKLLALGGVIVLGIVNMASGETGQLSKPFEETSNSISSYAFAFYSGVWALSGWEYLCYITGELKQPKRDLRIALIISLTVTTGIYILANIAYASVLTKEEMLSSPAVAVAFAEKTMGPVAWIMSLCVAISVLGSAVASVLAHSRMFYMGAKEGHLPYCLSLISVEKRTPAACILAMGLLGLIGLFSKAVFYAMEMVGFLLILFQIVAIIGLIVLRHKQPNPNKEVIEAPFAVPQLSILVLVILASLTIYHRPISSCLVVVIIFVCSTILYSICVKWKTKPKKYTSARDVMTKAIQRWLMCIPEEI